MDRQVRILILEDNASDLELIKHELRKVKPDHVVEWADCRENFLTALKRFIPDLVMLDYSLPGFDGLSALAAVRQQISDIPAIIVSGAIGEEAAIEALKAGATDYVLKQHLSRLGPVIGRALSDAEKSAQHKRAEEALRESEERYRGVVQNTSAVIFRLDPEGIIRFANKRALEFFGYGEDELVGKHAVGTIVPARETSGRDLAAMVEEITADPNRFHTNANENIRKNGERVWMEWTNSGIYDGEGRLKEFLAVGIDATERKRAEQALRESEERTLKAVAEERQRLYDVLDGLPAMVCLLAPDYHVAFANQAFRARFGEPHGRHCYEFCMGKEGPCEFCEAFKVLETGRPHRWETGTPDGSVLDVYDCPFTDTDGSLLVLEMDIDITESRRAEAALRESENKANALVAELEKADRNKNEFIKILSHELRNPLAAISAGIQILDVTKDTGQTEKAKEIMKRQMNQLCKLVDDLLDLTRITQNKIKLRKEYINLNEIVKSAAEDIKPEYEKKGIRLGMKIQTQPVFLNADPVRITQIIGNLLTNANKFTQENGVVWITLNSDKSDVVITIKDNGVGISPEILPLLFTPFVQAENTLDRSSGGLGLGLSIVKGIIDLHQGSISAQSAGLGKGSSFTIRLPITMGPFDINTLKPF